MLDCPEHRNTSPHATFLSVCGAVLTLPTTVIVDVGRAPKLREVFQDPSPSREAVATLVASTFPASEKTVTVTVSPAAACNDE
jgi:hypothetical protein